MRPMSAPGRHAALKAASGFDPKRLIKKGLTMRRLRASIRPCARLPYDRRPTRHVGAHERREVGCSHSGGCGALALELRAQLGIIKGRADRRIEPIGERV